MVARSLERALENLARRQHGVFHRRQVLRIGFTKDMIKRRLRSGAWIRLPADGVYALPSHPGTWERQCMAATLSVPAGAVSGLAAAALHRVPGFRRGRIQVVTRHDTTNRSGVADVRQSRTVGRFTIVSGIRVVSLADCTVQVAGSVDAVRLRSMVGHLDRHHKHYLAELRDRQIALAASRLPGAANLRHVLARHLDERVPPDSDLEVALRDLVRSVPRVGSVVWQARLPFWPRGVARCDGLAIEWPLILEADGRRWHTRVEDFERDRWRDNLANVHGYDVLRFTYNQLVHHTRDCRTSATPLRLVVSWRVTT
jgi:hypothetical protein